MVPNGWKDGRITDIVKSLDAGVSVNSEDDKDLSCEYKILKTSCVSKGTFDGREVKSVKERSEIVRLKEPALSNSIIVSRMNTPALVGANAYIRFAPANTYLPDRLWQVKPKSSKVDMCWLGYWFGSRHARYTMSANATGTSGSMKNITKSDVMSMKVAIPPLPEQQKIAEILSTWDKAITTTEKLIATSQQQKKALMQQLLTGKKRLVNPETGKVFEGDWEEVKLKDLFELRGRVGWKGYSKDDLRESGPLTIGGTQISKGYKITLDKPVHLSKEKFDESPEIKLEKDDIILVKTGNTIGKSAIYQSVIGDATINPNTVILRKQNNSFVDVKYFHEIMKGEHFQKTLWDFVAVGAQPSVNQKNIYSIRITLPSTSEQQKIASVLTASNEEIELLEAKLAHLNDEKKALMQQLLTGKRRVKV
ncbi:restriction endonuclease subunit S [Vibrio alginolyticus]|nr:restriction endonuclease subunit S [Vibrio alginolyticus]